MKKDDGAVDQRILDALEHLTRRLEDLFILQACEMGIKKEPLRKMLGIDKNRIARITKHVKKPSAKKHSAE